MLFRFSRLLLVVSLCVAFCRTSTAQRTSFSYIPVAADYSTALDKALTISTSPDQLHIIDPVSGADSVVPLAKPPLSLSVSPDGLHAAIGQNSLITYVNLSSAAVERTFPVPIIVQNLALAPDYVYAFSLPPLGVESVQISTGIVTQLSSLSDQPVNGKYSATQHAVYGILAGGTVEKFDALAGPLSSSTSGPGSVYACSNIWLSQDEARLYTGCSGVYQATTGPNDLQSVSAPFPGLSYSWESESTSARLTAAIQTASGFFRNSQVLLFNRGSYTWAGELFVSPSVIGDQQLTANVKWAFFNGGGTAAVAISTFSEPGDLTQSGAALDRIQLAFSAGCQPSFLPSADTVIPQGAIGNVLISGTPDCAYQFSTPTSWLKLLSSGYASAGGAIGYIARPNPTDVPRTGTITMDGQTFTITQSAKPATVPTVQPLSFNPDSSAYSKSLDKLILVSGFVGELHVYDPVSASEQVVSLPHSAVSLSLSPDGLRAAIGSYGFITLVDLRTATVQQSFSTTCSGSSVYFADNGYVYCVNDPSGAVASLNTQTGIYTSGSSSNLYLIDSLIGIPSRNFLYDALLAHVNRWDTSAGVATLVSSAPQSPTVCGNAWVWEDSSKIMGGCGNVYATSTDASIDLAYAGSLPSFEISTFFNPALLWATDSSIRHTIAVIPIPGQYGSNLDSQIDLFDDQSLNPVGSVAFPTVISSGQPHHLHGVAAYFNSTADRLYVLATIDDRANLNSFYALYPIAIETSPGPCSISLGATGAAIGASATSADIAVTSAATCAWGATSHASWLTITAGGFGGGSATASYSAAPNTTSQVRTGTITIAGLNYTVTQAAAVAVAQLQSPTPNTTLPTGPITFTWSAGGTGTTAYWLDVGNSTGQGDISAGQTTSTNKTVSGLPCDGRTLHLRLWTQISGTWQTPIDYTVTACNGPVTAQLLTPAPGSAFATATQAFAWSAGASGTDAYWLDVGNSLGHGDISAGQLTATSKTVSGLPCDGRTLYVRLWTHLSGAWQTPNDYTFSACNTGTQVAMLLSPNPAFPLLPTETFTWSPGPAGTDAYWLDIGNSAGHGDISAGQTTDTRKIISGIPCDDRPIYVRLWTHIAGNWQTPIDYLFYSCDGAPALAKLTAPAPGSTLTTTSPTFTWSVGASATNYWLDVGNSLGRGDISAGATTATSKTVTNLPCDGRTIYVRLWTAQNGTWQTPYDYTFAACH